MGNNEIEYIVEEQKSGIYKPLKSFKTYYESMMFIIYLKRINKANKIKNIDYVIYQHRDGVVINKYAVEFIKGTYRKVKLN